MDATQIIMEAASGTTPLADLTEAAIRGPLLEAGLSVRDGQVAMARATADAVESGGRLAVEAPCGTGKGLGYLLPGLLGVLRERAQTGSFRRMVVSTAGIALQRQLVEKDVPALGRALGVEITSAVLKGRSNYACPERLDAEGRMLTGDSHQVRLVAEWIRQGGSGDRDDLPMTLQPATWSRVSVSSEECLGASCPFKDACPANRARDRAMASAVVVVNHWFLAVGSSRLADGHTTLLVVDEAHDLEDALRSAGSSSVRESTARHWSRVLDESAPGSTDAQRAVTSGILAVVSQAEALAGGRRQMRLADGWDHVPTADASTPPPVDDLTIEEPLSPSDRVRLGVAALRAGASRLADPVAQDRARAQAMALDRLADRLDVAARPTVNQACAWLDHTSDGRPEVRVAPVAPMLPGQWPAVVACSATLGGGGDPARSLREVLRAPRLAGLSVPSPWPLASMGVAIVPDGPLPSEPSWAAWVDECAVRMVTDLGGGVLVLCTSLARSRAVAERLRAECPEPVRCQGEAGRSELVDWFARERDSVLVGSRSLFQGIDVPGAALRGVLIDRVPFPSPDDPMEEAVADRLRAAGKDPFRERTLLLATTLLRQAAGRLIRASGDRGAVVLTDPRVWSASWGPAIARALAPFPVVRDLDEAGRVWRGGVARSALAAPITSHRVQR